ncbi:alginate lyase family protein [Spirosoma validum]|uniref:alginate lyase family protein n=1 Tax=Spirosoma validum TaxID=2771355 RepID=UPI00293BAB19|nr:alginate lyase family protein [Spirosoma validum]
MVPEADKPISWEGQAFTFLNQRVDFESEIDWNYAEKGKLWTYNLNYFDFLNQPNVTPTDGLQLIHAFMGQTNSLQESLEPYPTSLRIINWIQFLSRHRIQDDPINAHLFAQTQLLSRRLEYHLAGNHLLENGFALLIGSLYFQHKPWFAKAIKLICTELTTQILADGCHDERSPMYHQILLDRLLTVLFSLQHDTWHTELWLIPFMTRKADLMLNWLTTITFRNGDVPMVNDAAFRVAPTSAQLRIKADRMNFLATKQPANEEQGAGCSGYRMFRQNRYELFVDVGAVGPNHQPGHAHADTFSFILHVDNQPVLVDSGTSTYQIGQRRARERSTAAHNTIEIASINSSEVWAGFRVGRRAQVILVQNTERTLTARHDGYQQLGVIHQRSWSIEPAKLTVVDQLLDVNSKRLSKQPAVARFHFHPNVTLKVVNNIVMAGSIELTFKSVTKPALSVTRYKMAEGFNQLWSGQCLEVFFTDSLKTTITSLHEHTLPDLLL